MVYRYRRCHKTISVVILTVSSVGHITFLRTSNHQADRVILPRRPRRSGSLLLKEQKTWLYHRTSAGHIVATPASTYLLVCQAPVAPYMEIKSTRKASVSLIQLGEAISAKAKQVWRPRIMKSQRQRKHIGLVNGSQRMGCLPRFDIYNDLHGIGSVPSNCLRGGLISAAYNSGFFGI